MKWFRGRRVLLEKLDEAKKTNKELSARIWEISAEKKELSDLIRELDPAAFLETAPLKEQSPEERSRASAMAKDLLQSESFRLVMNEVAWRLEQAILIAFSESEREDAVRMKQLFQSIKREVHRISRYGQ